MLNSQPLLEVKNLKTSIFTSQGEGLAVNGVDFTLDRGESLAVVGESGCGKSALALSIIGLVPDPPGKITSGEILFENRNILRLSAEEKRLLRGRRISMIFQEPMTALNPVLTIGRQVGEGFRLYFGSSPAEAEERSVQLLREVGIPDPEGRIRDYPHQLSGGMRQRVAIAMAVSGNPSLILADEPTTALDVTVQAQILSLLNRLRQTHRTSIMLITHDLGVAANFCSRILVMYAGMIVEEADTADLFGKPLHPYTQGLMNSLPGMDFSAGRKRISPIPGVVPGLFDVPDGCPFHPRCPRVASACTDGIPEMFTGENNRRVRCILYA